VRPTNTDEHRHRGADHEGADRHNPAPHGKTLRHTRVDHPAGRLGSIDQRPPTGAAFTILPGLAVGLVKCS
jgi:hypothetical protein